MPPNEIQVDEGLINDIAAKLNVLRNETSNVRNGSNPGDSGHPKGFPLLNVQVLAGGPNWPLGDTLKQKLQTIGSQVDGRFVTLDQKIAHYSMVLRNLLNDSNNTEEENIFSANFMGQ